jgi:hypothetical protein
MLRRAFLTLLVAVVAWATTSQLNASIITVDPDGALGADGPILVNTLDFSPGNSLAVGASPLFPGTPFDTLFQATLGNFLNAGGIPVMGTGLNSTYEWTVVAGFGEITTSVTPVGTGAVATFALGPSPTGINFIEIYYDPTPDSSNLSGTGFNDGVTSAVPGGSDPILRATVVSLNGSFFVPDLTASEPLDQNVSDDYPGQLTVRGSGGINITARIDFIDTTFFLDPVINPGTTIDFAFVNTSNIDPFNQADPSDNFVFSPDPAGAAGSTTTSAGAGVSLGAINGVSGPDFQFQSDANASLNLVPEPSSLLLCGLGAIGLLGRGIRRRKAASRIAA